MQSLLGIVLQDLTTLLFVYHLPGGPHFAARSRAGFSLIVAIASSRWSGATGPKISLV